MGREVRLAEQIRAVLRLDPTANALEFGRVWRSWGEIEASADRLGAVLDEAGIGPEARVGVLLRNHADLVPVILGLFLTNRCLASLNAVSPDAKLAADVADAATPAVIAIGSDWERPGLRESTDLTGAAIIAVDGPKVRLGKAPEPDKWRAPTAPGIAIEMLSSGTTGKPKRIPLKRRNLEKALAGAASYEKGREVDAPPRLRSGVQIVTAPLAHIAGITGLMNNLLAGRKVCLIERFTVEDFRDAVVRHRPKVAGAPPSALRMLLDADIPKEDFASLVAYRTGTAPLDPDLADAFYARYGIPVLQNYGATEFAGGVAGWTLDDFKAHWTEKRGSVGRLNNGAEARVVDPEGGDPLPANEEGLLELRAPNIGDGRTWVRTTDLAMIDADRFLWIRGRHDGAIIRGGFKILPDDVVGALQSHPAVREAAVTGIEDARLGTVPVAAWIARAHVEPPSEGELRAWLKEKLLPYQVPVRLLRVDELPRTPSLKVSQPDLKALFEAEA
ncbi:fatty acid--CoA ligase family protein [Sphingosinicella sp. LHD-64]|uniref:class I adenylate-forming enzyme family protein n=1 Tax=Sphingosinicella sp. LHD-64 TaxID=3072139 RepID=UPI00280DDBF5|nr:fatty acid--CoA ligase family protein [Sphingosinicella sp. LHD-64]MDQ8757608.1 fatty acid--CoA ligase family protein [Sphingosinicella sp. LHD-64]